MELGTYPKKRVPENAKSGTRFSNMYPKREFWVHKACLIEIYYICLIKLRTSNATIYRR